eukprot:1644841-Alexandrium_andersonii.AAC.1
MMVGDTVVGVRHWWSATNWRGHDASGQLGEYCLRTSAVGMSSRSSGPNKLVTAPTDWSVGLVGVGLGGRLERLCPRAASTSERMWMIAYRSRCCGTKSASSARCTL